MRLRFIRFESDQLRFGLIYGSIVLCLIAAAWSLPLDRLLPACIFRSMTGLSCPTCGATRALLHFSRGELLDALSMNPIFMVVLLSLLAWMLLDGIQLLYRKRISLVFTSRIEKTILRAGVALLFLANWIYLIVRHS